MSPTADEGERVQPETAAQWRAWLAAHHATSPGVWFVTYKRNVDAPSVGYDDAVTEALAYGWIDSIARRLDDDRTLQWYSPRRPTSGWSRPNKIRIGRLLAEGRMAEPGQRALDIAIANGSWTLLDDVENLVVPDDLASALAARPGALEHWESYPRSVRRLVLEQLVHTKRAETRLRKIAVYADRAARGERPA